MFFPCIETSLAYTRKKWPKGQKKVKLIWPKGQGQNVKKGQTNLAKGSKKVKLTNLQKHYLSSCNCNLLQLCIFSKNAGSWRQNIFRPAHLKKIPSDYYLPTIVHVVINLTPRNETLFEYALKLQKMQHSFLHSCKRYGKAVSLQNPEKPIG